MTIGSRPWRDDAGERGSGSDGDGYGERPSGPGESTDAPRSRESFLYVSPYFPPQTRVGALRALKFVRHLPDLGWHPVVLADLKRGDPVDLRLIEEIPETVRVRYDYGRRARDALREVARREGRSLAGLPLDPVASGRALLDAVGKGWNPEWVPMGGDLLDIPWAIRAGRRILATGACRAIVVNSAPEAALLVGARLSRDSGLPLILDLRDPWAPCELKRPTRPSPQRKLVDALERRAVERAGVVVLNTATARDAYRDHYPSLPPGRFAVIPNGWDPDLARPGEPPDFRRFTLLFLGGFRRHLDGRFWTDVLADLRKRLGADSLRLAVYGDLPPSTAGYARQLGVADMIDLREPVPYPEIGSVMDAADLLVLETQPGVTQRVPAKLYDYRASERPILAVSDSEDVAGILRDTVGARVIRRHDRPAVVETILAEIGRGRRRRVHRPSPAWTARDAAAALAALLDRVTGTGRARDSRRGLPSP